MILASNFSELLGYTSICCWLGAQFPQILENIKQQSCESLALPFLFNWMLGDASNLIGCLLTHQLPFQTYLASYFCFVDCCLLAQYVYYGGGPKIPPNVYARPRSRTTSSARRLSVDTSHYRTLSAVAGSVAAAAALAAHPDAHPEHRHPHSWKHGEEQTLSDHTPRASGEIGDEGDEAVLSALAGSFHSENGRRKRVSWSQERQPSVTRRQTSPSVAHHTLQITPTTPSLPRGRPLQREFEPEDDEDQTERRAGSRASRRGAGMVFLGVWALVGIGRLTSSQYHPLMPRSTNVGRVLDSSDVLAPSAPSLDQDKILEASNSQPSFVSLEIPVFPDDVVALGQGAQPEQPSAERVIGRIFAWLCTTLYLTSRLPQIWKNYVRKSVEGLSMYLFVFAFLGNFFYVCSILSSPQARLPPPHSTEFFRESIPYLLGSGGTFVFDISIVTQSFIYKGRHPRVWGVRSRGNSLARSAAIAEEEAGLLRGDVLAASYQVCTDRDVSGAMIPHSRSRTSSLRPNNT
ncbi:PQ loop repeat-domain-containing protein [Phlebopus sp. FC_14]|nr:PQ loop repeat-domain-containing protein [Phlebopus sp. FC_14]